MGSNMNWLFLGFLSKQIYTYYGRSEVDDHYIRLLAIVIIAVQLVDAAAQGYAAYGSNSRAWGISGSGIGDVTEDFSSLTTLDVCLASVTTQWFFTWRIVTFAKAMDKWKAFSRLVSALVLLLSICATGCGLTVFVAGFVLTVYPTWWDPVLMLLNASMSMADILITGSMTGLLLNAKSQTTFGGTRGIVNRLIRLTLQTGLLTTFLALGGLIFVANGSGYYGILWAMLTKSYAISLFANLNARGSYQRTSHGPLGRSSFERIGAELGLSGQTLHLSPLKSSIPNQSVSSSVQDDGNYLESSNADHVSGTAFAGAGEGVIETSTSS